MSEIILEEGERQPCLHPGNGCWYVDSKNRCANRVVTREGFLPCKVNGWGRMPSMFGVQFGTEVRPDRDEWRKEHGLCDT